MMEEKSQISEFYKNQTIFVTGATGFIGKLVVEKLLRSCHDLKKIYILVRIKKNVPEHERFKEIFDKPCFDPLKEKYPNFAEKVSLIRGDCEHPYLGLSDEDKSTLINEVNTIFHVAATVRFDQHLRKATHINVRATLHLLEMAEKMQQLRVFVHVSTAYTFAPTAEIIEEKYYEPPIKSKELLELVEVLDHKTIADITPKFIKSWPNNYAFTKAVAEEVVDNYQRKGLPVCIVRPGVVVPCYKEPIPGYVDNMYGHIGICTAVGGGLCRVARVDLDKNINNILPADYVVNSLIVAAYDTDLQRRKSHPDSRSWREKTVYNCVSQNQKPMTGRDFRTYSFKALETIYIEKQIWMPFLICIVNPTLFAIADFFLHTVPAYFVDFGLTCMGKKPFMVDVYRKVGKFFEVLAYFSTHEFVWKDDNFRRIFKDLSPHDKKLYNFDFTDPSFIWEKVLYDLILGGKMYVMKEDPKEMHKLKWKVQLFKVAHYTLCALLLYLLYQFLYTIVNIFSGSN